MPTGLHHITEKTHLIEFYPERQQARLAADTGCQTFWDGIRSRRWLTSTLNACSAVCCGTVNTRKTKGIAWSRILGGVVYVIVFVKTWARDNVLFAAFQFGLWQQNEVFGVTDRLESNCSKEKQCTARLCKR